jgi:hypothetical protein
MKMVGDFSRLNEFTPKPEITAECFEKARFLSSKIAGTT